MSNYQLLGADAAIQVAAPSTYSRDELKNVIAFTHVKSRMDTNRDKYLDKATYGPGTPEYSEYPWLWADLPRNQLEDKGTWQYYKEYERRNVYKYGIEWKGRAFSFKNPQFYINTLQVVNKPADYIKFLKLAPLAGFNVTGTKAVANQSRGALGDKRNDAPYNGDYAPVLPPEATGQWWQEVITYDLLRTSFTLLRMAQIEDQYYLEDAYMNSGKLIDSLKAEMRSEEPVDVLPRNSLSSSFRVMLRLETWEIEKLEAGLNNVRKLIDENRKKMAKRVIELQSVDAKIVPTAFSTDPLQNPFLVFNPERSAEAGQPIFTNQARNSSATWAPPEVASDPANMQYWEKVPEYTAQHERVYATEYGPMSEADILKYGLDGTKRTNWLPWIAAGAAVAYAATQIAG